MSRMAQARLSNHLSWVEAACFCIEPPSTGSVGSFGGIFTCGFLGIFARCFLRFLRCAPPLEADDVEDEDDDDELDEADDDVEVVDSDADEDPEFPRKRFFRGRHRFCPFRFCGLLVHTFRMGPISHTPKT